MRINNNIPALHAVNMLRNHSEATARIMRRLSSGLRIMSAADDAAGLAISEKMRSQIRGINQAVRNAQDGLSLLNTAEGALSEMHSILQRIRDLAVQAANDTNTSFDREEAQKEIEQLKTEIDRISHDTEFNTRKIFSGRDDYASFAEQVADIIPETVHNLMEAFSAFSPLKDTAYGMGVEFYDNPGAMEGLEGARMAFSLEPGSISLKLSINLGAYEAAKDAPLSGDDLIRFKDNMLHELVHVFMSVLAPYQMASDAPAGTETYPKWFAEGVAVAAGGAKGFFENGTSDIADLLAYFPGDDDSDAKNDLWGRYGGGYLASMYLAWLETDKGAVTSANLRDGMNKLLTEVFDTSLSETVGRLTGATSLTAFENDLESNSEALDFFDALVNAMGNGAGSIVMENLWDVDMPPTDDITRNPMYVNASTTWVKNNTAVNFGPIPWLGKPMSNGGPVYEKNALTLHIGANEGQNMKLSFVNISSRTLNINTVSVLTQEDAEKTITHMDAAINVISSERARLGAQQNRLEHTIRNLMNTAENLQAAESRIRDQDMAAGILELAKAEILRQAATAVFAQTNRMPRSVLRLLN